MEVAKWKGTAAYRICNLDLLSKAKKEIMCRTSSWMVENLGGDWKPMFAAGSSSHVLLVPETSLQSLTKRQDPIGTCLKSASCPPTEIRKLKLNEARSEGLQECLIHIMLQNRSVIMILFSSYDTTGKEKRLQDRETTYWANGWLDEPLTTALEIFPLQIWYGFL